MAEGACNLVDYIAQLTLACSRALQFALPILGSYRDHCLELGVETNVATKFRGQNTLKVLGQVRKLVIAHPIFGEPGRSYRRRKPLHPADGSGRAKRKNGPSKSKSCRAQVCPFSLFGPAEGGTGGRDCRMSPMVGNTAGARPAERRASAWRGYSSSIRRELK